MGELTRTVAQNFANSNRYTNLESGRWNKIRGNWSCIHRPGSVAADQS